MSDFSVCRSLLGLELMLLSTTENWQCEQHLYLSKGHPCTRGNCMQWTENNMINSASKQLTVYYMIYSIKCRECVAIWIHENAAAVRGCQGICTDKKFWVYLEMTIETLAKEACFIQAISLSNLHLLYEQCPNDAMLLLCCFAWEKTGLNLDTAAKQY